MYLDISIFISYSRHIYIYIYIYIYIFKITIYMIHVMDVMIDHRVRRIRYVPAHFYSIYGRVMLSKA